VGGVENTPKMMGWEKGKTYNLDAFTEQVINLQGEG